MSDTKKLSMLVQAAKDKKAKAEFKEEITKDFTKTFNARPQPKFKYSDDDSSESSTPIQKMIDTPSTSQENSEAVDELQVLNDNMLIVSVAKGMHVTELNAYKQFRSENTPLAKALAHTISGSGADWVPTKMSNKFIEEMEGEFQLANQFEKITIPKGVGSLDIPGGDGNIDFYKRSDSNEDDITAYTASTPTSRKVTLTPVELAARVQYSTSMMEDAAFPVANWLRGRIISAAAKGIDDALVNGDTAAGTSSAIDSDMQQSADAAHPRASFMGIRNLTPAAARINSSDIIDVPTFRKLWAAMITDNRDYGADSDLIIVCNRNGYLRLLTMLEVNNTNDDRLLYPAYSTSKTMLPNVYGIPIVITSAVRRDLNATYVYDGTTTTESQIFLVNKKAFVIGDKRRVTVEMEKNITTGRYNLVCTLRMDFKALYGTTEPISAFLYNFAIAT